MAKGKKRVAKRVAKRAGSKTKKRVITKKNKAAAKKTRGGSGDDAVTKGVKIKNGGKEIFITDKVEEKFPQENFRVFSENVNFGQN